MVSSPRSWSGKLIQRIKGLFKKERSWQDFEYFHDVWKDRVHFMSKFLDKNASVMDLGCGEQWLKNYISSNITYTPVDYKKRSDDTIVADFNKKQFPLQSAENIFISGCLEYIEDPEWFIAQVCRHAGSKIILSYCVTETHPDISKRKELMWKNHLSTHDIINHFDFHDFHLQGQSVHNNNTIFVFNPCQK